MNLNLHEEDLSPKPPTTQLGIGIVGCGEIVNLAHLKAYTDAGITPIACFDLNREAAEATAGRFGIPTVAESLESLLEDPQIQLIDIAIHMSGRPAVFEACVSAGKHVLMQKPVAHSIEQAEEYVALAQKHGCLYQVNQQARWAPTHQAVKKWIEMGAVGRINQVKFDMRGWQDDPATWYVRQENFTLVDHGVHYFDLLRFFVGKRARRVAAMQGRVPGQVNISPVIYSSIFDFGDGLIAEHSFNNKIMTEPRWGMSIVIEGEEGSISCDFETARLKRIDGMTASITPKKKWFPDAFLGPMADLMDAISQGREPRCSGEDNLETMRMVLGALESATNSRIVSLD